MKSILTSGRFVGFLLAKKNQYYLSTLIIAITIILCAPLANTENYHTVSYLLLFVVALLATFMELIPVVIAAVISALAWNFFFIPPHFTFQIGKPEDILVFLMFFLIAMLNGVLTNRMKYLSELAQKAYFLDESDKLYKTLFNSISHELRIPVATIMGASESLITSEHQKEVQTELLKEVFTASVRLNRVIENLLNMSRIESGRITIRLDWHDINDLINKVTQELDNELRNFNLIVKIQEDMPLVKIDFGLMEHALYNLLLNATEHSPVNSEISISIYHRKNELIMVLKDSGPGFPPDKTDQLFDKFFRIENSKTGGLGLGLSIVKGFIEAHKGKISVTNGSPGGAVFTINIPSPNPDIEHYHTVFLNKPD
ncbi:MAG TPA: ATP-binding protein [Lentimicrobium sp.]|nr:ATP-binding protein [Lentimicrobium sp.]